MSKPIIKLIKTKNYKKIKEIIMSNTNNLNKLSNVNTNLYSYGYNSLSLSGSYSYSGGDSPS